MARLIGGGSAPAAGAGTGEGISVMVAYCAVSSGVTVKCFYRCRGQTPVAPRIAATVLSGSGTDTSSWAYGASSVSSTRTAGRRARRATKSRPLLKYRVPRTTTPGRPVPASRIPRRASQGCGSAAAERTARSGTRTSLWRAPSFSSHDSRTTRSGPSTISLAILGLLLGGGAGRRELLASLRGPASRRAGCVGGRGPAERAEGVGQMREGGTGQRSSQQAVELAVEDGGGDGQESHALGGQLHDR